MPWNKALVATVRGTESNAKSLGAAGPVSSSPDRADAQSVGAIDSGFQGVSLGSKGSPGTPEVVAGQHAAQQITEKAKDNVPQQPQHSAPFPRFIKSLNTTNEACFRFLLAEGAIALPSLPLQQALVKSYIEYAYPRMPVLDLEKLCGILDLEGETNDQISLLLYHTILWAGSSHVRTCDLLDTGYANKRTLRDTLYRRVELLYELSGEQDRLVLIQTALLLTFRGDSECQLKDSWHWMNAAVTVAYEIGINTEPPSAAFGPTERTLRRRLWWCCYTRDKILALGSGRPCRIKTEDYDVCMLRMDDMDLATLKEARKIFGSEALGPYDGATIIASAELCVEKTKLSVLMHRIIQLQQGFAQKDHMAEWSLSTDSIDAIDTDLESWLRNLPDSCHLQPLRPEQWHVNILKSICSRQYLLHMAYHFSIFVLHRPRELQASFTTYRASVLESARGAQQKALTSAGSITRLAADLHNRKIDSYLPVTAITALSPAISTHLFNMKSQSRDIRDAAISGFRVCMRIMYQLRDLYPNAEITLSYLDVVLQKEGIGSLLSIRAVFQLNERDRSDLANVLACGTSSDTTTASSKGVSHELKDARDAENKQHSSAQVALGLSMGFAAPPSGTDLVLGDMPFPPALDLNSEHGPGPDFAVFEGLNPALWGDLSYAL
ncbi:cutinase transcription factor 1 beta [Colletotrichum plurivorum]|uniref:Cutinase transcription factor 1 beta n=1 Tax=Colletotrichum plurivorum TaxID=2175906 RepID=A0A8H6NB63_9PEZI|nr:cutinase transcription factor 1 beta [Colletotrichum plurivorum]